MTSAHTSRRQPSHSVAPNKRKTLEGSLEPRFQRFRNYRYHQIPSPYDRPSLKMHQQLQFWLHMKDLESIEAISSCELAISMHPSSDPSGAERTDREDLLRPSERPRCVYIPFLSFSRVLVSLEGHIFFSIDGLSLKSGGNGNRCY